MLRKRSCPAVSQIWSRHVVAVSGSSRVWVMKEAPTVEGGGGRVAEKGEVRRRTSVVLPTAAEPRMTIFASREVGGGGMGGEGGMLEGCWPGRVISSCHSFIVGNVATGSMMASSRCVSGFGEIEIHKSQRELGSQSGILRDQLCNGSRGKEQMGGCL